MCDFMMPSTVKRFVLESFQHFIRNHEAGMKEIKEIVGQSFHINDLDSSNLYSKQKLIQMKREMIWHLRKSVSTAENLKLSDLEDNEDDEDDEDD